MLMYIQFAGIDQLQLAVRELKIQGVIQHFVFSFH